MSHAFRAPLAERSAVNRQVLGSIPSGGGNNLPRAFPPAGGSSVVEQWTVKCLSAAIHWSGVQISLPGLFYTFFIFCAPARTNRVLQSQWCQARVV